MLKNLYRMLRNYYRRMAFKPYTIHKEILGMPLNIYIADSVGKEWYDTGNMERQEIQYLKNHFVAPGEIILECGGHHGVIASYLSKCIGSNGQMIVFEPSPFNAKIIKKNLELNQITNVKVENKAIGDVPGKMRFSTFSNGFIESSSIGTIPVDVTTIDDYAYFKPTMLMIDVEGYDVHALKGARNVLKTRPKIALEIHTMQLPSYGNSVKDIFDLLDLSDYDCTIMDQAGFHPLGNIKDITTNVHLYAIPR